MWCAYLVSMVAALALCAAFCGLETGVYVLNKARLDLRAERGWRSAKLLKAMLARPGNLLVVLLVGTNLAAYLVTFAISAMFLLSGAGRRTEWYTIAAATPLLFILGDSVPKNIFHRHAEVLVYRLVWALRASSVVFNVVGLAPLVRGFAWLVIRLAPARGGSRRAAGAESLWAVVAEGAASGVLTDHQAVMADRVMRIKGVALGDVMVPMSRVVAVTVGVTRGELVGVLERHNYSRLPVVDEAGGVVGVLNIYDVLTDESLSSPTDAAGTPLHLAAGVTVTDALYRMKQANSAMAIVVSKAGRPEGIVTIKDIVEEIVGELQAW